MDMKTGIQHAARIPACPDQAKHGLHLERPTKPSERQTHCLPTSTRIIYAALLCKIEEPRDGTSMTEQI
jgi:hypothetical protein